MYNPFHIINSHSTALRSISLYALIAQFVNIFARIYTHELLINMCTHLHMCTIYKYMLTVAYMRNL